MISILLFIAAIVFLIYKWLKLNDDYFLQRGVPFKPPKLFFGNASNMLLRKLAPAIYTQWQYNQFPDKRINGIFEMRKPSYLIRDPELLKQIAVKDFDHFLDHRVLIDSKVDKLFGNSLISLQGQKWKDMRSTLSPVFTSSKMKQMFDLVSECGDQIAKYLVKESSNKNKQILEMKDLFSRFTNDVIATSAFGIKVDSLVEKENEFFLAGKNITNFAKPLIGLKFIGYSVIPKIMKFFKITLLDKKYSNFFANIIQTTMKHRLNKGIVRPDMINLLLQAKKGNLNHIQDKEDEGFATVQEHEVGRNVVKREWSDDELIAQCFLFFFAGFDTSSTLMSFLSHELAINPEIQDRLFQEVMKTNEELEGKPLTYDALQKMKYLDMVISETLRKWPPAPFTDRFCVKDYLLKDDGNEFIIEKGTALIIPIYGLHHDPKYFPNPEKFDPERFNNENKGNINLSAYIPFGIGPRNCIGSRFALMEAKAVFYYILRSFSFEVCEKTEIPLTLSSKTFQMVSSQGVWLELKSRSD